MLERNGTKQIERKTGVRIEAAADEYKKQGNIRIKTIDITIK